MKSSIEIGSLVKSTQGHDLNRVYFVLNIEGDYAFCVDGIYRLINNPKKKKIKHLSNLFIDATKLVEKLKSNCLYDFEIKTLIKNKSIMHKN